MVTSGKWPACFYRKLASSSSSLTHFPLVSWLEEVSKGTEIHKHELGFPEEHSQKKGVCYIWSLRVILQPWGHGNDSDHGPLSKKRAFENVNFLWVPWCLASAQIQQKNMWSCIQRSNRTDPDMIFWVEESKTVPLNKLEVFWVKCEVWKIAESPYLVLHEVGCSLYNIHPTNMERGHLIELTLGPFSQPKCFAGNLCKQYCKRFRCLS